MSIITKYGNELYLLLIEQGFWPDTAKMITAQAAHETGNFTSTIFLLQNNPFGMKVPVSRRTTTKSEARGHAVFDSIESAARDYWLYYQARKYPAIWKDTDTFVEALKRNGYFEGDLDVYKRAVKNFHQLYFNE